MERNIHTHTRNRNAEYGITDKSSKLIEVNFQQTTV